MKWKESRETCESGSHEGQRTKQMPNNRKRWMKWMNEGLNKLQRPFCKRQAPNRQTVDESVQEQGVKVDLLSPTWHTVYPFIVCPCVLHCGCSWSLMGLLAERKQWRHEEGVRTRVATDASLANSHSPRFAQSKRARGTHEASVSRLMCSVTVFLLRPACLAACLRPCCQRQSTSHMPLAPPQVNNNNNKNMATARATAPLAAAMIFEINSTWFCFLACCFCECEGVDVARGYWRPGGRGLRATQTRN